MESNVVYHLDFLRNKLPDHCANLIIADPPYFEVKGDFDFTFDDFQCYLQHVEAWAKECARILAEKATLSLYHLQAAAQNAQRQSAWGETSYPMTSTPAQSRWQQTARHPCNMNQN